jgi:hypothetical protein
MVSRSGSSLFYGRKRRRQLGFQKFPRNPRQDHPFSQFRREFRVRNARDFPINLSHLTPCFPPASAPTFKVFLATGSPFRYTQCVSELIYTFIKDTLRVPSAKKTSTPSLFPRLPDSRQLAPIRGFQKCRPHRPMFVRACLCCDRRALRTFLFTPRNLRYATQNVQKTRTVDQLVKPRTLAPFSVPHRLAQLFRDSIRAFRQKPTQENPVFAKETPLRDFPFRDTPRNPAENAR